MPIRAFLRAEEFSPETLKDMSDVFTRVCEALDLKDRTDPLTELVARRIIELAQRGVRTQTELYLATMNAFNPKPQ